MNFLVALNYVTVSGLNVAWTISSGKYSCFFRSTIICQLVSVAKILMLSYVILGAFPSFNYFINLGVCFFFNLVLW